MIADPPPSIEPDAPTDATTSEPPESGEARHSVLTPMGEVESIGSFARGLGPRRLKIAIAIGGALALLFALLTALTE